MKTSVSAVGRRTSLASTGVAWSTRGVYLAAWATLGIFLWIPRLVGAVLLYSLALVQSTIKGTSAVPAGRHLRSGADFYRSFVGALESVHTPVDGAERSVRVRPTLREVLWAVLVWYVILWSTGVIRPPVELASSLAAAPWAELWSSALETIASVGSPFPG